nr:SUF system NifU family Fe-S cluster assembly protein [Arthrobacter pigmenti]
MESLYQQIILDHARRRVGQGIDGHSATDADDGGDVATAQSHQLNPVCGDEVTLRVWISDSRLQSVAWDGAGCAISMASASVLTELVTGRTRDEVMDQLDRFRELMRSRGAAPVDDELLGDATAFAGVSRFPARVKCAMLAWVALEEAVLAANR